jgi:Uma2 family endonuclease
LSATGKIVTTSASQSWPQRHQFTAEEYNWMAEVGLLSGESPVELIEGEIIHMPPSGTHHRNVVKRLHAALESALASRAVIEIQRVVRLGNITEAQPDLIVTRPDRNSHAPGFATGNDTLLVIEVSDTTLLYDHDIKAPVYAAHGIPEVWIVDLQQHRVHFFRSPVDGKYTEVQVCGEPGLTKLTHFSDSDIDLSGLPL